MPRSRASLTASNVLPGVHRVKRTLADGTRVEHWYIRDTRERILSVSAKSDALLQAEVERALPAAVEAFNRVRSAPTDKKFLAGLITRYLEALETPEFSHLAPRTKSDRRQTLDRVRTDLGGMELKALESGNARSFLLNWRKRYADTPRTADALLGDLSLVLTWANDSGEIPVQPIKEFPRLYNADRAEIIWTDYDLAALLPECSLELRCAILLAIHTGARLGDLRKLTWSAVGENAMTWQTGKSNRRRTVVVPITPELRQVLSECPRSDGALTILVSSRKRPWTQPGIETALRKAKIEADKKLAAKGDERRLKPLRWHDFRGTAATTWIRTGMELQDVATILGWETAKVKEIARRYVSSETMAVAILDRWRNRPGS